MDKVKQNFNKIINTSIIILIIDIIVGVLLIASTTFATQICSVIIGSLFLIKGIYSLIRYIYDGIENEIFKADLISGIASIIIGIFTIFNPYEIAKIIGLMYGIFLLINGFYKGYYAISFMKINEEIYPLITFISILNLVMAIVVIINPFETFMLITKLIGYFLITSSLLDIVYYLLFKKRSKEILKLFNK